MTSHDANYLYLDGTTVKEEIIGVGSAGIVVIREGYAFKIPRISKLVEIDGVPHEETYGELTVAIMSFKNEKAIYKRLGDHPGIIRCYNVDDSEDPSIQMPLMNGDLRHYLDEIRPERSRQFSWLLQLARTMAFVHTKRVVICDLRLDNIVYDDNMNIRLIDFSESSLMHPEWDLKGYDKYGCSILTDIGQFGAVMFEIVTGQYCSFDIYEQWKEVGDPTTWPRRETLPSTSEVWLGSIIEKCWTKGFASAGDLERELEKENIC
ncbi:serine/threonine protein kinase [Capronia epimyces CBS 606.96]|uniref:Serine/threonine protein kinase n=1 Tax=Capronia epimyces CBS 606.96 TaxID=1182542 RepID=W9YHS5_9EURO|nr:serine/threonine protein kinase [Capronia epimyces CBS 606.96]EXJ92417.1 serine/threonine protein kinase [Capronia epimyces CBS 606.96]